jgi:hypothetical protein
VTASGGAELRAVCAESGRLGAAKRWDGATCQGTYAPLSFSTPHGVGSLIIVAGHTPYEERLLILKIDDAKFFDCRFQGRCLVECFDYADERAGRPLDGAINFPFDRLLGHGRAKA